MSKKVFCKFLSLIICISFLTNGCAYYHNIPDIKGMKKITYSVDNLLYYQLISHEFIDSLGIQKVEEILKSNNCFNNLERYFGYAPPQKGYYVSIKAQYRSPTVKAICAMALSTILTLTAIPSWSTQDGFNLYYDFYYDGKKVKTFYYEIKRFIGIWIVFLPFVWVNLFTSSKEDAFEAATYQFLNDVQPYLTNESKE